MILALKVKLQGLLLWIQEVIFTYKMNIQHTLHQVKILVINMLIPKLRLEIQNRMF